MDVNALRITLNLIFFALCVIAGCLLGVATTLKEILRVLREWSH